jgi:hypothetical protein
MPSHVRTFKGKTGMKQVTVHTKLKPKSTSKPKKKK